MLKIKIVKNKFRVSKNEIVIAIAEIPPSLMSAFHTPLIIEKGLLVNFQFVNRTNQTKRVIISCLKNRNK